MPRLSDTQKGEVAMSDEQDFKEFQEFQEFKREKEKKKSDSTLVGILLIGLGIFGIYSAITELLTPTIGYLRIEVNQREAEVAALEAEIKEGKYTFFRSFEDVSEELNEAKIALNESRSALKDAQDAEKDKLDAEKLRDAARRELAERNADIRTRNAEIDEKWMREVPCAMDGDHARQVHASCQSKYRKAIKECTWKGLDAGRCALMLKSGMDFCIASCDR